LQGEQTVIAVLGCWGAVIYGASAYMKGKKKPGEAEETLDKSDAKDTASELSGDLQKKAEQAATSFKQSGTDKAQQLVDSAEATASDAKSKGQELKGKAEEKVTEAKDAVKGKMQSAKETCAREE
jgi:hypothetical protein